MAGNITPQTLRSLMDSSEPHAVIDVRERGEFNRQQIFRATSLPRRDLEYQMQRMVPAKGTRVIVCDDDGRRAMLAAATMERMGYSHVSVLDGGLDAWTAAGYPVEEGTNAPSKDFGEKVLVQHRVPEITPQELHERLERGEKPILLDTRTPEEFERATIPGSRSMPGGELTLRITDAIAGQDAPVIIHCGGRTRSIIGTHILRRMGLPVVGLQNGTMGWLLAGYELQWGSEAERLPEPSQGGRAAADEFAAQLAAEDGVPYMSVPELQDRMGRTGEETFYLVDVRTAEEYEAGHIPGSAWFPGGQAVQRTDEVVAVRMGTVVLACDGRARATVTASWYRQMGLPNVYALYGGVTAWAEQGLPLGTGWPAVVPAGLEEARANAGVIAPQELSLALGSPQEPVVVDLETSRDFSEGHIPGARWVPRGWLELRIGAHAADKNTHVVLTSRDGVSSTLASATLHDMGYTQVSVLDGGTTAWTAAGLVLKVGPTGITSEPGDVVAHPLGDRARMEYYLTWEEALGKKYEELAG